MFLKSLHTRLALTKQRFLILRSSHIKIGYLLLSIKLFQYALTIFICFTKSLNNADMARKIFKDSHLAIVTKVLLKSIFDIWKYFWATSLALYLATNPSEYYFILNTYFKPIATKLLSSSSYSHILYYSRLWSSSLMVFCHW